LLQAVKMLRFDRFDFLTSSAWPWTSYWIYKNLKRSPSDDFLVPHSVEDKVVQPPRLFAAGFTHFSSCTSCTETGVNYLKPLASASPLKVFSIDNHASVTLELFHVLNQVSNVAIEYYTLDPRCEHTSDRHKRYWCDVSAKGDEDIKRFINVRTSDSDKAYEAFISVFDEFSNDFLSSFKDRLRDVDLFICTNLPIWCLLYEAMNVPVLGWLTLITTWLVPFKLRTSIVRRFVALAGRSNVILAFTYPLLAVQHLWQTSGHRLPVASVCGLNQYDTSQYIGHMSKEVVVGHRPSEYFWYMLKRFELANEDVISIRFMRMRMQFELRGLPIADLVYYRAFVYWQYGFSTMLMHEVYAQAIPMWIPKDLWRWASHWGELSPKYIDCDAVPETAFGHPYAPRLADHESLDVDAAIYWSSLNEAMRLPHVKYFPP